MVVMSIEEAYCAFPYEAVLEDGMVLMDEHDALMEHLAQTAHIAVDDPAAIIKAVNRHADELGSDLLTVAGQTLPAELRADAYQAAVVLALSDKDMGPDEAVFLERARAALSLSAEEARSILQAIQG